MGCCSAARLSAVRPTLRLTLRPPHALCESMRGCFSRCGFKLWLNASTGAAHGAQVAVKPHQCLSFPGLCWVFGNSAQRIPAHNFCISSLCSRPDHGRALSLPDIQQLLPGQENANRKIHASIIGRRIRVVTSARWCFARVGLVFVRQVRGAIGQDEN